MRAARSGTGGIRTHCSGTIAATFMRLWSRPPLKITSHNNSWRGTWLRPIWTCQEKLPRRKRMPWTVARRRAVVADHRGSGRRGLLVVIAPAKAGDLQRDFPVVPDHLLGLGWDAKSLQVAADAQLLPSRRKGGGGCRPPRDALTME